MKRKVVDLTVDREAIDANVDKKYDPSPIYVKARAQMPEKQLFEYAEYREQDDDYSKIYAAYGNQNTRYVNWETNADIYTTADYAELAK